MAEASFSGLYVFGDSLSDTGNVAQVYAQIPSSALSSGAPSAVPGYPYYQGRFSNGPVYIDYLASALGFSATPSSLGGNNYAYGGARTEYQAFGPPFQGLQQQISSYLSRSQNQADDQALYVVWAGANNVQDLLAGKQYDPTGHAIPNVSQTIADLFGAIGNLYAAGARHFLIPNIPDLGVTPRVRAAGSTAVAAARSLALSINAGLDSLLQQFAMDHSDFNMVRFDAFSLLDNMALHPSLYGLSNSTNRCYTGDDLGFTGGGSICSTAELHLFWDGIHPSTAADQIFASTMLADLPEPTTPLLLVSGVLLLAARHTRHTKRS